ncbi:MAG: hypothetical protein JHC98_05975 [Thermoleophilaceae bacterium]|nr:hypothetical protein [Thermoleophilaceae bacterium]
MVAEPFNHGDEVGAQASVGSLSLASDPAKKIQNDMDMREFLARVLEVQAGGPYGVAGFVRLAEFVESNPEISWRLGEQSEERAYACYLNSDPDLELFRASNFGSMSFWLWRLAKSSVVADEAFREEFMTLLDPIKTSPTELVRSERGFSVRFASFAEQGSFDTLSRAILRLISRCQS